MQNAPSHAVETEQHYNQLPETVQTPEAAADETRERVSKTVELTVDRLSERLEEATFKMDKNELTVPELERLVADFCTYLTWDPADWSEELPDKVEAFYEKLQTLVAEAMVNGSVGGTSSPETDRSRKEALCKLTDRAVSSKVAYFTRKKQNLFVSRPMMDMSSSIEEMAPQPEGLDFH